MYTLEQAVQLQKDFAYIIEHERRTGMETGRDRITIFFNHGGSVSEWYKDKTVTATMPTNKKYLELKAKYFPVGNSLSIFYPDSFKKDIDNNTEI